MLEGVVRMLSMATMSAESAAANHATEMRRLRTVWTASSDSDDEFIMRSAQTLRAFLPVDHSSPADLYTWRSSRVRRDRVAEK